MRCLELLVTGHEFAIRILPRERSFNHKSFLVDRFIKISVHFFEFSFVFRPASVRFNHWDHVVRTDESLVEIGIKTGVEREIRSG